MNSILNLLVTSSALLVAFAAVAAPPAQALADNVDETTAAKAASESITADQIRRHAAALADDTFEGREAGSRGGRAAAGYLQLEFKKYGLKPAGNQGTYFQSFNGNCRNILGMLEGSDPKLKDEVIVVGAHYDHVGYGSARNSYGPTGHIHNGADDNASGVATLLEVAEACAQLDPPPKRSILFALWDSEENGLFGSKHWVAQPTPVRLDAVKLMINMDMVGRLRNNKLQVIGTRTARGLRKLVSRPNHDETLALDFTWELRSDSDHHSFYVRNIPVLMPHTGLHPDYHRPSDDVEKLNIDGMWRIARLLFGVIVTVADEPELPRFREAGRRESPGTQQSAERLLPTPPGRLGLLWDRDDASAPGLKIIRVVPGSAADQAGLKVGDRLLSFAGQELSAGTDLAAIVVAAANPVTARYVRAGAEEPADISITLRGQPTKVGVMWREDDAEPGSVKVLAIVPGSPVARAGVRPLERIYAVNGQEFTSGQELRKLLDGAAMPFELSVEANGRIRQVMIDQPKPVETH